MQAKARRKLFTVVLAVLITTQCCCCIGIPMQKRLAQSGAFPSISISIPALSLQLR